jgi:SAM-dependent methyltransferase
VQHVNENHARVCQSPEWAAYLQDEVLGPLLANVDLGAQLLELGPGPGAATDWLRHRVDRLVALESDAEAAAKLAARFGGTNVEVVVGDATALDYPAASFDSVGSFTMLHHVPTLAQQHAVLAESARVLRPGGVLVGSDSLASASLHEFHADDVYNPIDPAILLTLLRGLGFAELTVHLGHALSFVARTQGPDREAGRGEDDA